jgi:hypothetical protein
MSAMVPQVRHRVVAPFLAWLDTHADPATIRTLRPAVPRVLASWRVFIHLTTADSDTGQQFLADWLVADRDAHSDAVITAAFIGWMRGSLRHHRDMDVTVRPHAAAIMRFWFDYVDAITTHVLTESPVPLPVPAEFAAAADPERKVRRVSTGSVIIRPPA